MGDAKETLYGLNIEGEEESFKKEQDYKIITVSLYNEDIQLLENYVTDLKNMGYRRINKSKVIRYALRTLDISQIPKD